MKTIKELEAEFTQENLIIAKALKDVIKLIDEMLLVCDDMMLRELKARING